MIRYWGSSQVPTSEKGGQLVLVKKLSGPYREYTVGIYCVTKYGVGVALGY